MVLRLFNVHKYIKYIGSCPPFVHYFVFLFYKLSVSKLFSSFLGPLS